MRHRVRVRVMVRVMMVRVKMVRVKVVSGRAVGARAGLQARIVESCLSRTSANERREEAALPAHSSPEGHVSLHKSDSEPLGLPARIICSASATCKSGGNIRSGDLTRRARMRPGM